MLKLPIYKSHGLDAMCGEFVFEFLMISLKTRYSSRNDEYQNYYLISEYSLYDDDDTSVPGPAHFFDLFNSDENFVF